jgi:hypothetical protein
VIFGIDEMMEINDAANFFVGYKPLSFGEGLA